VRAAHHAKFAAYRHAAQAASRTKVNLDIEIRHGALYTATLVDWKNFGPQLDSHYRLRCLWRTGPAMGPATETTACLLLHSFDPCSVFPLIIDLPNSEGSVQLDNFLLACAEPMGRLYTGVWRHDMYGPRTSVQWLLRASEVY
jgi:hypothetical protein